MGYAEERRKLIERRAREAMLDRTPLDRYEKPSSFTERMLFHGYRGLRRGHVPDAREPAEPGRGDAPFTQEELDQSIRWPDGPADEGDDDDG